MSSMQSSCLYMSSDSHLHISMLCVGCTIVASPYSSLQLSAVCLHELWQLRQAVLSTYMVGSAMFFSQPDRSYYTQYRLVHESAPSYHGGDKALCK